MAEVANPVQPPARLRALASWQASKVSTLGARLTASRMPLGARADFAVLAALDEFGLLSQAELGRRLGLDRNDVNGVLNRLEGARHVDRQLDSHDRRRNIVTLTDTGHGHLAELQQHADAVQDELLAGLDPTEREQLHALLGNSSPATNHNRPRHPTARLCPVVDTPRVAEQVLPPRNVQGILADISCGTLITATAAWSQLIRCWSFRTRCRACVKRSISTGCVRKWSTPHRGAPL